MGQGGSVVVGTAAGMRPSENAAGGACSLRTSRSMSCIRGRCWFSGTLSIVSRSSRPVMRSRLQTCWASRGGSFIPGLAAAPRVGSGQAACREKKEGA
eukprot:scaffold14515_cov17-Tisochrysis_lutea.AAC.1